MLTGLVAESLLSVCAEVWSLPLLGYTQPSTAEEEASELHRLSPRHVLIQNARELALDCLPIAALHKSFMALSYRRFPSLVRLRT